MKRNLSTLVALMAIIFLYSIPNEIPVTQNLMPDEHPVGSFEDYQAQIVHRSTEFHEELRVRDSGRETWLCIVENELYQSLETLLAWWAEDLAIENSNVIILNWTGTSYEDMKTEINNYYISDDITGVFLLGDLPVFWFELWEDWDFNNNQDPGEEWVQFPMDQYFADLDGVWNDLDGDGVYDVHSGEVDAELAIGRLRGDNLSHAGNEVTIIQDWFLRNHLYRNGLTEDTDQALGYIDDDWEPWQNEYYSALQEAYDEVEMVYELNSTTADDYRENRWSLPYEWIQVHVHSGPDAHYFYQNNGAEYNLVYNNEVLFYQPQALFYNLFCCSNARFTESNSMGSLYVLGNNNGLVSIGSTKTGSMLSFENFYSHFPSSCLGESLRLWWNETVDTDPDNIQGYRSWFYGMVLTGDPTLCTEYGISLFLGDINRNSEIEAYDASLVLMYNTGLDPGNAAPLPWSPARVHFADTDGNGAVEAYDASLILQYFVEIISSFPVE